MSITLKKKKKEQSISILWHNDKRSNVHFIKVPEKQESRLKNNSEKLGRKISQTRVERTNIQIQEVEKTINRISPKKSILRHTMIKLKTKEKNL